MAKIGYIRVSTLEQNDDRQVENMSKINLHKVFSEKLTGSMKWSERPEAKKCIDYLRDGEDELYIDSLSRLGRNSADIMELVKLLKSRNIKLVSLKENLDTSTSMGEAMVGIMAIFAQLERDMMLERQKEGIAEAKKKGKYAGSKKQAVYDDFEELYLKVRNKEMRNCDVIKKLRIPVPTFYRWAAEYNKTHNIVK